MLLTRYLYKYIIKQEGTQLSAYLRQVIPDPQEHIETNQYMFEISCYTGLDHFWSDLSMVKNHLKIK